MRAMGEAARSEGELHKLGKKLKCAGQTRLRDKLLVLGGGPPADLGLDFTNPERPAGSTLPCREGQLASVVLFGS